MKTLRLLQRIVFAALGLFLIGRLGLLFLGALLVVNSRPDLPAPDKTIFIVTGLLLLPPLLLGVHLVRKAIRYLKNKD